MRSTGTWHKLIPRDPEENLRFRLHVCSKALTQAQHRGLVEMCRQDILFFISLFVWQYNGKARGHEVGPFVAWDFQEDAVREMLRWIDSGEDGIIEKSRDMGASWLCLIVCLWVWLFHPWKTVLVVSKSAEAVEDDTSEALFWKLDFILSYLPTWLLQGYDPRRHRRKNTFKHPNGSTIYGAASTGRAGVGAKCSFMFVDEFSQIKEAREVWHRTADTTDCRIINGTHLGLDTAFYELCDPKSLAGSFINKLQMHWTQHPEKRKGLYRYNELANKVDVLDTDFAYPEAFRFQHTPKPAGGPYPGLRSPWYDEEGPRRGSDRAVAMDLDINPSGSVSQFFDALTIRHLIATYACDPYWEADFDYDYDAGKPLQMHRVASGRFKLWVIFRHDGRPPHAVYVVGCDVSQGTGATPSCVCVLNRETGEKVLEYADPHIDPKHFASLCVALCWLFKSPAGEGAMLVAEKAGPGVTFGTHVIRELGYKNVWYPPKDNRKGNRSDEPWFKPSPERKLGLLNNYNEALRSGKFLNRSKAALEECLKFKYAASGAVEHALEEGREDPSGARMNHGDQVIADALAWLLAKDSWLGKKRTEPEGPSIMSLAWRRELRRKQEAEAV